MQMGVGGMGFNCSSLLGEQLFPKVGAEMRNGTSS